MEVKQLISMGACFFCLVKTNGLWCEDCEKDFIRERPRCPVCARKSTNNRVCGKCINSPPCYTFTEVLFNYSYPANELIKTFKFNDRPMIAKTFAELLVKKLKSANTTLPEILIPVPLHKKRQCARGYNQSLELARHISRLLGIKVDTTLCTRTKNTDPQSTLPMKSRYKNVTGAFSLNTNQSPKHIAIIDDVITTGSTINELAGLFEKTGCERIDVWAVARALN